MVKHLESRQNSIIKNFVKLQSKKGRLDQNKYIVDGLRIVKHALDVNALEAVIVTEKFYKSPQMDFDFDTIYTVTEALMKILSETDHPQGILGVVKHIEKPLGKGKILFLDAVQDPGNMGTLIRTADAAGFTGVLLRKGCTDPYNQKSLRSSMGSIMSMPIRVGVDKEDLLLEGYTVFGAALEGGKGYKSYTYPEQAVLVIGNEGNGISKEILDLCHHKVYIPMLGDVESLNASIAGGILMFEMQTCE